MVPSLSMMVRRQALRRAGPQFRSLGQAQELGVVGGSHTDGAE
jgi:hypothetical protein